MASSQQAANISEKNRAILYALKNEIKASNGANNMLASNGALLMASNNVPAGALNALAQSQATTTMNMSNMGVGQMIVHDKFDWSGSVLGSYPTINTMNTRNFIHRGVPPKDPQGSYGCVIYAGPNVQGGANNCAWVLAWKVLGDGSPNKVNFLTFYVWFIIKSGFLAIIVSLTINVCISDLRRNWSA